MGGSSQAWKLELDAALAAEMGKVREKVIEIGIEALDKVKRKTPVDTGHAQNNWIVSVGAPDTADTMSPALKNPKNGEAKTIEGDSFAGRNADMFIGYPADAFPAIYLQNNLPYALALEYGHSKQAPAGMVAMTVAELEAELSQGVEI